MTTPRRIMLTLGSSTTATECGDCTSRNIHRDYKGELYATCDALGVELPDRIRHPECLAAGAAASRMVEIAPDDARFLAGLVVEYSAQYDPEGSCVPLRDALRAHAKGDAK